MFDIPLFPHLGYIFLVTLFLEIMEQLLFIVILSLPIQNFKKTDLRMPLDKFKAYFIFEWNSIISPLDKSREMIVFSSPCSPVTGNNTYFTFSIWFIKQHNIHYLFFVSILLEPK